MADQESVWDRDVLGPGTVSTWDRDWDGPGTRSVWDRVPSDLSYRAGIVWRDVGRAVRWADSGRIIRWRG